MKLEPIRQDLLDYLAQRGLVLKWKKVSRLFASDIRHPSLHTELMEPKWRGIYSFRIDTRYRALFFFVKEDVIEVFKITNHYK